MEQFSILQSLHSQPTWVLVLSAAGLFSAVRRLVFLLTWVYAAFLRPTKDLRSRYGSWAIVTGATDGIGKSIAFHLAGKGLNLLLVGRNSDKLNSVSGTIVAVHPQIRIETVLLDLSSSGEARAAGIRRLREAAERVDAGVLVNNAGVGFPSPMFFHEAGGEMWMDVVRVNLVGTTEVTRAILPAMLRRRRGAVVNVGSGTSFAPSYPLLSVYAATKGYIDQLSRCLYVEYKNSGIDVQNQVPYSVATRMVRDVLPKKYSFLAADADAYAEAAVRWMGCGPRCVPHWYHSLQSCVFSMVPDTFVNAVLLRTNGEQREIINEKHQN